MRAVLHGTAGCKLENICALATSPQNAVCVAVRDTLISHAIENEKHEGRIGNVFK